MNRFEERFEPERPLARTQWTKLYLPPGHTLAAELNPEKAEVTHAGPGAGVKFVSQTFEKETEITGPPAAKLRVPSATQDADLFLMFRVFTPDLKEIVYQGALDPHTPIAQGWLRASHRELDKNLSKEYRPHHSRLG